jgi:hypothetical protein
MTTTNETSHGIAFQRAILVSDGVEPWTTAWGDFAAENCDDMPMLREVADALNAGAVASVGGGAAPAFTIRFATPAELFAATLQADDARSAALRRAFGKAAGDRRYDHDQSSHPAECRAAYAALVAARAAWDAAKVVS